MATTKTYQLFKIFQMTGAVESVELPIVGGCNIHQTVSDHINAALQKSNPYDNATSAVRNFKVVYGNQILDARHEELFSPDAKMRPDYDQLFDTYYAMTFLSADREGRNLFGKEFSEAAFVGAPPSMSVHVTISLGGGK